MAKAGFRVMDSDIHVMEPHDLWQRYIEPGFRDRAPRFAPLDGSDYEGWQFDGKVFPASSTARTAGAWRACGGRRRAPGTWPPGATAIRPRTCRATTRTRCCRRWTARA